MTSLKMLPVGIENFKEIRRDGFYYVDKTNLIKELLESRGKANLFTRPRRFGKSLTMSMFQSFFEIGCDKRLFDGLDISRETALCNEYMGKFPVISISLKSIDAEDFQTARKMFIRVVNEEVRRLQFLFKSSVLSDNDKDLLQHMLVPDMTDDTLCYSLRVLTELLYRHYSQKVILLIDEYDVPLQKANEYGYYEQMVHLIRNFFSNALKTNDNLYFAVLTGCLRVAKESIFTGLNNFNVYTITDMDFDEYFGFTDAEVKEMLRYYGLENNYCIVKEWYDGYRFGSSDIYCPWDVICYCQKHRKNKQLPPENYWINTSGNDIIKRFVESMGEQRTLTKVEIEHLIAGESVQKTVRQELTYKDLFSSPENIWSALFMTGYLTVKARSDNNLFELVIPNREIRNIFTEQIMALFENEVQKDGELLNSFCNSLINGEADKVGDLFTKYMQKTISVRDTFVRKPTKENFYHGILLGILSYKAGWSVRSNREAGNGFGDIMIWIDHSDIGIIIEVKYADSHEEEECQKAIRQIDEKHYADAFKESDIHTVLKYGIVCNRKSCRVLAAKEAF